MTSIAARSCKRLVLTDCTNVLNMKSGREDEKTVKNTQKRKPSDKENVKKTISKHTHKDTQGKVFVTTTTTNTGHCGVESRSREIERLEVEHAEQLKEQARNQKMCVLLESIGDSWKDGILDKNQSQNNLAEKSGKEINGTLAIGHKNDTSQVDSFKLKKLIVNIARLPEKNRDNCKEVVIKTVAVSGHSENTVLTNRKKGDSWKDGILEKDQSQNNLAEKSGEEMNDTLAIGQKNYTSQVNSFKLKKLIVNIARLPEKIRDNCKKGVIKTVVVQPKKKEALKVYFQVGEKSLKDYGEVQENHNLRKLVPKNYVEDSISETGETKKVPDVKKLEGVPIYKKVIEPPKENNKKIDEYEFDDFSPKMKKPANNRRPHRSSIVFDKNTYEILQKIEEKELKARKRTVRRRNKKLEQIPEKSYDNIVTGIVSNVLDKINKRNDGNKKKNNCKEGKNPKQVVINDFTQDMNIILHSEPKTNASVPFTFIKHPTIPNSTMNAIEIDTSHSPQHDPFDDILDDNSSCFDIDRSPSPPVSPVQLSAQPKPNDSDNDLAPNIPQSASPYVIENDISSYFGFDKSPTPPPIHSPVKPTARPNLNIISNVILSRNKEAIDSPADFDHRRPNANSTMLNFNCNGRVNRSSSPWRMNFGNVRTNPHFVSVKSNAMPRLEQDMVMEHSLVEEFESLCKKTPLKEVEAVKRRSPRQKSILAFVESNVEKENVPMQGSLFDYENFTSPVKKKIDSAKRKVLCETTEQNIVVSATIHSRSDTIQNSSVEIESNQEEMTYFGFDENTFSPEKNQRKDENEKPSRFDMSVLRRYVANHKKKREESNKKIVSPNNTEETFSIELPNDETDNGDIHIFDEPEQMLDCMPPVVVGEKRHRRKRLQSCDSDTSDCGKKRKRHKKTKFEVEQEKWIEEFNSMCEDVDQHELEYD